MPNKPQIGRNIYRDVLVRGREHTAVIRNALKRLVDENPGPQTQALLVTRIAIATGSLEAVFSELDEIGKHAKDIGD